MGYPLFVYQGRRPRDFDNAMDAVERLMAGNDEKADKHGSPVPPTGRVSDFIADLQDRWPATTESQLLASPWHDMPPWESAAGRVVEIELKLDIDHDVILEIATLARHKRLRCVNVAEATILSGR